MWSLAGGECTAACGGDQWPRLCPFGCGRLFALHTPHSQLPRHGPFPPQMSRVGVTGTRADGQCPGLWGGPSSPGEGRRCVCTGWRPARSGHPLARLSRNDSLLCDSGPCSQMPKGAAAPRKASVASISFKDDISVSKHPGSFGHHPSVQ